MLQKNISQPICLKIVELLQSCFVFKRNAYNLHVLKFNAQAAHSQVFKSLVIGE